MEMVEKLAALKYWGLIASSCILGVALVVWVVEIIRQARKNKPRKKKQVRRRYIDAGTLEDKIWEMIRYDSYQKYVADHKVVPDEQDAVYYKAEINALRMVLRMIEAILDEGKAK